jgi:hypothetical protein
MALIAPAGSWIEEMVHGRALSSMPGRQPAGGELV